MAAARAEWTHAIGPSIRAGTTLPVVVGSVIQDEDADGHRGLGTARAHTLNGFRIEPDHRRYRRLRRVFRIGHAIAA
ncbi:hypothetical protein [Jannaschia sp. LMIT008]|uniref:hypothetical protein n=1 Tax=Jannaschia maritima TaxID=3032585 RepID=UPI00281210BB|nr:hypothetical protein [Jannaschia sp. LMIT008]